SDSKYSFKDLKDMLDKERTREFLNVTLKKSLKELFGEEEPTLPIETAKLNFATGIGLIVTGASVLISAFFTKGIALPVTFAIVSGMSLAYSIMQRLTALFIDRAFVKSNVNIRGPDGKEREIAHLNHATGQIEYLFVNNETGELIYSPEEQKENYTRILDNLPLQDRPILRILSVIIRSLILAHERTHLAFGEFVAYTFPLIGVFKKSRLSTETVERVLQNYDLGEIINTEFLKGGRYIETRPILMVTTKGKYVLKVARTTEERIAYETSLVTSLHSQGFPVLNILRDREGKAYFEMNGLFYSVSEFREGSHLSWGDITGTKLRNAAILQARLHKLVKRFKPEGKGPVRSELSPGAFRSMAEQALKHLETIKSARQTPVHKLFLQNHEMYLQVCLDELAKLRANLPEATLNKLPNGIIHGDYYAHNIIWQGDEIAVLLDWETAGEGARVYDLANEIIIDVLSKGRTDLDVDKIVAYVQAYQQAAGENRLTPEEIKAFPEMLREKALELMKNRFEFILMKKDVQGFTTWPALVKFFEDLDRFKDEIVEKCLTGISYVEPIEVLTSIGKVKILQVKPGPVRVKLPDDTLLINLPDKTEIVIYLYYSASKAAQEFDDGMQSYGISVRAKDDSTLEFQNAEGQIATIGMPVDIADVIEMFYKLLPPTYMRDDQRVAKKFIGIPAREISVEERQDIEARIEKWLDYDRDVTVMFLEGEDTEANVKMLQDTAKEEMERTGNIVVSALVEMDLGDEKAKEAIELFIDRATAEIFSINIERMSREELRRISQDIPEVAYLKLNEISIFELETMKLYERHAKDMRLIYNQETIARLKTLKDKKETKCVVWTTGVEQRGLPLAVDINERRRLMGVTKHNDPVKDVLVIRDSRIKTEADIDKYLRAKGLDRVINKEDVILRPDGQKLDMHKIYSEIAERTGIKTEGIVFAGLEDEFKKNDNFMLVELAGESRYNIGLYRWVFELFTRGDQAAEAGLIEKLGPKWYRYIPPVAPADYEEKFREYQRYVNEVLTKA
ncbi:MAG: phosphotransferase, partial [Candidatus Omnitrophota bacterium]